MLRTPALTKTLLSLFFVVTLWPATRLLKLPQVAAQQSPTPAATPVLAAHFHHLHLNTTDPQAAIEFYTGKFAAEKARFAGAVDAVWTQKSWLLFNQVKQPPKWELNSAIWHFGWGAENMKAEYERQLKLGTKFFTPLTDISDIGGNQGATGLFYYAYVESPDKALIELNTANHHNFGHLHLFSADPLAASDWYVKMLGAQRRGPRPTSKEPRFYRDVQIGPSASLMLDNVNIIIFPVEYAKQAHAEHWRGKTELEATQGHATDHLGVSVDKLDAALASLKQAGVKILEPARTSGPFKSAFIEGPDKIRIEIIEGHPQKN